MTSHTTPEEKRALLDEFRPDDAADSSYSYFDELVDDDKRGGVDAASMEVLVNGRMVPWADAWRELDKPEITFSERALQRIDAALRRVGA